MTHCAIYQANPLVQCVLHIHSRKLWHRLLDEGYESTPVEISYGTPEMALSLTNLVKANLKSSNLVVMAGHEEGVIAYGEDILSAFDQIKTALNI
jgi:ribulose-5-phosphate 4-epimerase/fuculose-1-phosphate aldolase